MPAKFTTDLFILKARAFHGNKYDYSKVDYTNSKTAVCIICPKHGEFYLSPDAHLKHGCDKCAHELLANKKKEKAKNAFITKAEAVHNHKYDYSKVNYIDAHTKVCIICPVHGEFYLTPTNHLSGYGCDKCGHEEVAALKRITVEQFKEIASKKHNNKYDYSQVQFNTVSDIVTIICSEHGPFQQLVRQHMKGCGCPKCSYTLAGENRRKTTEEFIAEALLIHSDKYDYSKTKYVNCSTPVTIICKKHGEFQLLPHNHLFGKGCPHCVLKSLSKLFNKLIEAFPGEHILFEVNNKTIEWLPDRNEVDIYFPDYNIAVEYDGLLHFIPIEAWGGETLLKIQQERDLIRNQLCRDNNCYLFRLKYDYTEDDFNKVVNNIKEIIVTYEKSNRNRRNENLFRFALHA